MAFNHGVLITKGFKFTDHKQVQKSLKQNKNTIITSYFSKLSTKIIHKASILVYLQVLHKTITDVTKFALFNLVTSVIVYKLTRKNILINRLADAVLY